PLATYQPDGAEFPAPAAVAPEGPPGTGGSKARPGPAAGADDDGVRALRDLVAGWTDDSSGHAAAVVVAGTAEDAAGAVGAPGPTAGLDLGAALAWMAWAGASGGRHGRRRGMAAGRFAALWTAGAFVGLLDEWPVDPERLGGALARIRFLTFEVPGPPTGWRLGLAAGDPEQGRAWAVSARDPAADEKTRGADGARRA
ncbi:MAG TPA: hypothetical protein VGR90_09740, partial [Acidimicrobiales bacterium]|nr:hypothetical protein [Acidimicrobiales bacterium]